MSSKAFLTGVLVAGILATGALVTTSKAEVVAGKAVADEIPAAEPGPLGDSMKTGRGPDLTGLRGGAASPLAQQPKQEPAKPKVQPPGTVRLPEGGTAKLVRKEITGGALPVPDGIGEATWWGVDLKAAEGATVLAGHVDWHGATGPFAELWRTQAGFEVSIVDGSGAPQRFRVAQVLTVKKAELPQRAVELFGPRGAHRLVLVTCGGQWVGGQTGYEANRVVIAERIA